MTKAGLIGVFKSPKARNNVSSIYMISDESARILFIFVLFPGAYQDAYEIASKEIYPNIIIVPVSMDALYVSDVVRLANDLTPYKNCVKIVFPGKAPSYMPVAAQKAMIKTGHTTFSQYTYGFVAMNYQMNEEIYQPNFYDIYVTFKRRRIMLCPFQVDKTRVLNMLKNNKVDWLYVPYSNPLFGDTCFVSMLEDPDFEPYLNKLVAMGFNDQTHANYCKLRYPNNYPRAIYDAFLNGNLGSISETGNPVVVGGIVRATDEDNPDNEKPELPKPPLDPEAPFPKPVPPEKPERHDVPDTNGEIKIV